MRHLNSILIGLIILQVILLVVSLPGQRIHGDEASFAEFSYFGARDGYIHSELFRGLLGYEGRILLYHKLFVWLGVVAVWLCGFGIWPLRALSLLGAVGLIGLLAVHYRPHQTPEGRTEFLAATAFLLLAPLTFTFAKLFRPEVLQAAFGLATYLAADQALRKTSVRWCALSGALAGLAMLIHLNGAIFVAAGGILLLSRRQWRLALVFGAAATVVFSTFFYEIIGRVDLFWRQYAFDPTFGENERTIAGTVMKLLEEHKRLFRKPEIIFTSTLFFLSAAANLLQQGGRRRDFYVFTATCMVALGALAPAKTTPYAILLFPFFAMEVAHLAVHIRHSSIRIPRSLRYALGMATVAFILHSIAATSQNAFTNKQDWVGDNRRLATHVKAGAPVLAPLDFIFNEITDHQVFGMRLARWKTSEWPGRPLTTLALTAYADSAGAGTIILDDELIRLLNLRYAQIGDIFGTYRVSARFDDIGRMVLIRK